MRDLCFLIHNLSRLAPDYDRCCHRRAVDILVESWAREKYIMYDYHERHIRFCSPAESPRLKN